MTQRLCRSQLDRLPANARPGYDPREVGVGIVHLGVGAFHRAHQAVYTDAVLSKAGGDWGICAVAPRSAQTLTQLVPQDGLYSVLVRQPDGSGPSIQVMAPLVEVVGAREQPEQVVARLADPAVAVVSLTVTEKAYHLATGSGRIDLNDPAMQADLAADLLDGGDRPPSTVPGLLLAGLARRARTHSEPLTVLCCDNILDGGQVLAGIMHDLCDALGGGSAAGTSRRGGAPAGGSSALARGAGAALAAYLDQRVRFPSSMVDRITPAATEEDREEAARLLGVRDEATVAPEAFSEWVIEDNFAGPRPAWEQVGVTLPSSIGPWQVRKLRVLNAGHSLVAYLGRLLGYQMVAESVADPDVAEAFRLLITEDVAPSLPPVPGEDLDGYRDTVLARFANPAIGYRNEQVGSDGSQKLPQRLLGIVRDDLGLGHPPRWAALALAAWLRYLAGTDEHGRAIEVNDPLLDRLVPVARGVVENGRIRAEQLQALEVFGDDLAGDHRLTDLLTEWLQGFARHGVAATLAGAVRRG